VCEDNKYAISVEKGVSTAIASNADRAGAYGMPGVRVEHNDALEVFEAAGEAVARARRGGGPSLIEVKTDRYMGHFQGDPESYRPKGEVDELRRHDPIPALGEHLRRRKLLDDSKDAAIRSRAHQRVTEAYDFARTSAYPDPAEALQHVFVS
jgi:TPP-dependent pyruvate/acetoin dehydrogenase alpha subunit